MLTETHFTVSGLEPFRLGDLQGVVYSCYVRRVICCRLLLLSTPNGASLDHFAFISSYILPTLWFSS